MQRKEEVTLDLSVSQEAFYLLMLRVGGRVSGQRTPQPGGVQYSGEQNGRLCPSQSAQAHSALSTHDRSTGSDAPA